ncbi:hypothetical protein SCHPADRAFT_939422 [Schizopora paradoxa]|uniref:Uncharacterized protein n=1 Tax=Schizopora paradoxa TaxID=27342 RepID=A0A0H2RRK8_9AGAM|nr:hypothetical protein SCHPADRAFT_939422 [Schizopora paradoxa]
MSTSDSEPFYGYPGAFQPAYSTSHLHRNRTAENLPGPGRTLGRFYEWAGDLFERGISSARASRSPAPPEPIQVAPTPSVGGIQSYLPNTVNPDDNDQNPSPSHSTFSFDLSGDMSAEELRTFVERNATASNLPGPGRLLGRLYEIAGRVLERRSGRAMERRGRGPRAIMAQIMAVRGPVEFGLVVRYGATSTETPGTHWLLADRSNEHEREGLMYSFPTETEQAVLRKLVKNLVDYTFSGVQATQQDALECITELTIADSFLRNTLRDCLDNQRFNVTFPYLGNNNDILLNSSRRALISVSDVAVSSIMQEIFDLDAKTCASDEEILDEYIICNDALTDLVSRVSNNLIKFILNPDTSFLVLRYLQKLHNMPSSRALELIHESPIQEALQHLGSEGLPISEWSALNICLNPLHHFPQSAASIIPILLRQPDNFRFCAFQLEHFLTYDVFFCCSAYAAFTAPFIAGHCRSLVKELSGESSLSGQLRAVTCMKRYIAECLGGPEIPTWASLLTARPSIIFAHLVDGKIEQYLSALPNNERIHVVRDHDAEHHELLKQLISLTEEGEQDERGIAVYLVQVYKGFTRYTWMDVKQIAAELPHCDSKSLILEDPAWGPLCRSSGEHLEGQSGEDYTAQLLSYYDSDGELHVYLDCSWSAFKTESGPSPESISKKMSVDIRDILWVEHRQGEPLEQATHHFIQAGVGPSGEPLYLASDSRAMYSKWLSTVTIGATFITDPGFRDNAESVDDMVFSDNSDWETCDDDTESGDVAESSDETMEDEYETSDTFSVLALRYDPEILSVTYPQVPPDVDFHTGPLYWS